MQTYLSKLPRSSFTTFLFAFSWTIVGLIALTSLNLGIVYGDEPSFPVDVISKPSISVSGSAVVRVAPDEAVLTFSIASQEEKLDEAVTDNDQKVAAVNEFLKESKISGGEIRTQVISIRPIFENRSQRPFYAPSFSNGPNTPGLPALVPATQPTRTSGNAKPSIKPIGYNASRQLSITINDLDSFEAIYRGLIERGVNVVGGVDFRTKKLREYKDQARINAVKAAKEKAVAMAGELDAKVIAVRSISEDGSNYFGGYAVQNSTALLAPGGDSIGVASGMIEIKANVSVVFLLGDTEM